MLLRRHKKSRNQNKQTGKEIDYKEYTVPELKELAKEKEITGYSNMKKDELIETLKGD